MGGSVTGNDEDDDDDEFLTPASSPEPELEPEVAENKSKLDITARNQSMIILFTTKPKKLFLCILKKYYKT